MTESTDLDPVAFPRLTPQQLQALRDRSTPQEVGVGDVLFRAGDTDYDMITVDTATVRISRAATLDDPAEVTVAEHGAGRFIGEWNLLTGQAVYLTATVTKAGLVHRMGREALRSLMSEDAELSDVILRALLARRDSLRVGAASNSVEILGAAMSAAAHDLRTWAARQQLVHRWVDVDTAEGAALLAALGCDPADLPVAITPTSTIARATPGQLAEALGLSYRAVEGRVADVVVVGAGPAGLAAAVYGASEGLSTLLVDAVAVGGQAAASSRIENYLGFPSGISGAELTNRGLIQAQKFGAQVNTPCRVTSLSVTDGGLQLRLADGTTIDSRAIVLATGAAYRTLPLERWDDFEGAGIYFAATDIEARACAPDPVTVVGGANSAGQAAIFLAERGSAVTLVVRGADLAAGMSAYLVDRVTRHPGITVRTGANVTALHGGASLEGITVTCADTVHEAPCRGLFCFIGAAPATGWLGECGGDCPAMDDKGFLLTDNELADDQLPPQWGLLGRRPLPFETSVPGVFAVGDVRLGSMKRVAAAVGEGASAIRSVHAALATSTA